MAVPLARGLEAERALLAALADGAPHGHLALARALGVGEHEIAALAAGLAALGVPVRRSDEGLALAGAVELLDAERIRASIAAHALQRIATLEVFFAVDSTNTLLLERPPPPAGAARVALAELQLGGRGRRGRTWITPFGGSIALSLGWSLRDPTRIDPTLSLAVGVAVVRALERCGAQGIGLKWPNDVWLQDRKIGGILAELKTGAGGGHVVIGIGLNLSLSADMRAAIEADGARVACCADACAAPLPRNALVATLLSELLSMLELFEQRGFAAFREEWSARDALDGRRVRLVAGEDVVNGISRGVDADGAMLIDADGRTHRFVSGEASLRLDMGES